MERIMQPLLYLLHFLFFSFLALESCAQGGMIGGTVRDANSAEPVVGCSISMINSSIGTTCNSDGRFLLVLPKNAGTIRIIVSSLGYISDTIELSPSKHNYPITLRPTIGALGEVVVTGVSKATLVRENPVPVSIVSSRKIEQSAESNIIDVFAKNVPGLNVVKTGPNISKPFIRGLGYNRVLTLYDGIRQEGQQWGDEHGLEVDAFNIEKGEVIKGPSSLIYGSDALAGVVSLLPAMPVDADKKIRA